MKCSKCGTKKNVKTLPIYNKNKSIFRCDKCIEAGLRMVIKNLAENIEIGT